jgi:ABC-type branched-subunit amino acid transport system ATPase component
VLLELRNVRKNFGSLVAVDDISLRIERGEIFGLAGPNGAGKTSLFNVISGIPYQCDSGQVVFDGVEIQSLEPHLICRRGLTRTFQTELAFESLTVEQNILIGAMHNSKTSEQKWKVAEVLDMFELAQHRSEPAESLPLHQKKRLMLATAVVCSPLLLLLDEPAAGLDRDEYSELAKWIKLLREIGITVLIIEHVLPLLLSVSTRVAVMSQGKIIALGPPSDIMDNDDVIAAYLGQSGKRLKNKAGN